MGFRDFDIPGVRKCGIGLTRNPIDQFRTPENIEIPKSLSAYYRPRLVSPRIVGSLNVATTPA